MKRFIARIKYYQNSAALNAELFKKNEHDQYTEWEDDSLPELQKGFWHFFHSHDPFWVTILRRAFITDRESGNTWEVNDWGRKVYK